MDSLINTLNEEQKSAALTDSQNSLILAGAGTGKTRAITSRIIYLINNKKINPHNILAVTFTNKAADEMKQRIMKNITEDINIMIKTFHSFGSYILRMESFACYRTKYFQIHDAADSKKVLNEILKKHDINKSELDIIYRWIQEYKQKLEIYTSMSFKNDQYKNIYIDYNKYLETSNCFDFEDLILQPIKIFIKYPEILNKYQNRFKYILVDEYQDTNKSQFELLKLLAGADNNIMVVGDEDQSIYKFRGADINNILNFKHDFVNTEIFRLEQNYRSTTNILNLANHIIKNNNQRLGKNLYSTNNEGNNVVLFEAIDDNDEVAKVLNTINNNNFNPSETAILYRTNNQSRSFEQILNRNKISYKIVGSIRFFEREEIKDAVSILKWIVNPKDKTALSRFINKPAKGIGEKSLEAFFTESEKYNDLYQAMHYVNDFKSLTKKNKEAFNNFFNIFNDKDEQIQTQSINKILLNYLHKLKLWEYYESIDEKEKSDKISNLNEFLKSMENIKNIGDDTILSYLEEVSLTDYSKDIDDNGRIKLMTVHNAKGLEFDNVFITGMETGLFPHQNSIDTDEDYEEERRLFYVAITRARKNLIISYCKSRNIFGRINYQEKSQFINEIPIDSIDFYPVNDYDDFYSNFNEGDVVIHKDYGKGKIIRVEKINGKHLAKIDFWDHSFMELILEYTDLEKVYD